MRAVGILATGGTGQGDAADGTAGGRRRGEPAIEAAVMEVVVAAGVHPALALLCFSAADATSMGRRRVGIF